MLRLRPYKPCDGEAVARWFRDEREMHLWCADGFDEFPLTAKALNAQYDELAAEGLYQPMTAFDESGVVGHLFLKRIENSLRLGYVVVDAAKRGQGYGQQMLALVLRHGFEALGAESFSLAVFGGNESAFRCYDALGFRETAQFLPYSIMGEDWRAWEMEMTRAEWETSRAYELAKDAENYFEPA